MCLQHASTMCLIQGQGSKQPKSSLNWVSGNQNRPTPPKKRSCGGPKAGCKAIWRCRAPITEYKRGVDDKLRWGGVEVIAG